MLDGTGLEWTVCLQIFLEDYHSSTLFLTSALCYKIPLPKINNRKMLFCKYQARYHCYITFTVAIYVCL
jgi:hypothetical protein